MIMVICDGLKNKQINKKKKWQCDSEWQKSKVIKKNTIAIVTKICDSLN